MFIWIKTAGFVIDYFELDKIDLDAQLPTQMADNPILHYLPPGWTEETFENPSDADFEGLTEEV